MGRGKAIIIYIVVITLGVISFYSLSLASTEAYRDRCRKVDLSFSLPPETLPFEDIERKHIQPSSLSTKAASLQSLQDPFERQGKFNEAEGGAIILVITNRNQAAKLLASVEGTDLLIRKFITYKSSGETAAQGENLRLSEGDLLDLDGDTDNPSEKKPDLLWKKDRGKIKLQPLNGARLQVLDPIIAVPVIGHFMQRQDPDASDVEGEEMEKTDVEKIFSTGKLQKLLAPDGRINTIWKQAGIFFFLYRLERCVYSLQDFFPGESNESVEGIPYPLNDCQRLFRRINRAYNFSQIHGLDFYIWWKIWGTTGYAAQHRKDGPSPGPGAIWVDTDCPDQDCGLILAHEAGHFLGLCHICVTEATPLNERGQCGFCPNIRECSRAQRDLLMRDDALDRTGRRRLIAVEIRDARKKAFEHRLLVTGAGPQ
jgi:hypothetical protein